MHELNCMLQVKLPITLKSKDLATCGFPKKSQTHSLKPTEVEASFRKVSLPPAKLHNMLFPTHL